MNDLSPVPSKIRNIDTHKRHRKEVFWQVTVPVGVSILFFLVLAYLAIFPATADQDSVWADISLIFLIIPVLLVFLLMTVILMASVYLTAKLMKETPFFMFKVHQWLQLIDSKVQTAGSGAVEPFLRYHSFTASIHELVRKVRRIS